MGFLISLFWMEDQRYKSDQLVDIGVVVKDSMIAKKGYRYQRIYKVFVGIKEYI